MTTAPETKKLKHRSPAYPCVGLAEAINHARQFWDKEKTHEATPAIAAQHFGFKAGSSTGMQVAAALSYYGLMQQSGMKESRTVKLTDLAISILKNQEPSRERDALLKKAALKPALHARLAAKYGEKMPSAETLKNHLEFDEKFNPGFVDDFIRQFLATLEFAGIGKSDTMPPADIVHDDDDDSPLAAEDHAMQETERLPERPSVPSVVRSTKPAIHQVEIDTGEVERLRFNLKSGRVRLMFIGQPTQADIAKLIAILNVNLDTFPETAERTDSDS